MSFAGRKRNSQIADDGSPSMPGAPADRKKRPASPLRVRTSGDGTRMLPASPKAAFMAGSEDPAAGGGAGDIGGAWAQGAGRSQQPAQPNVASPAQQGARAQPQLLQQLQEGEDEVLMLSRGSTQAGSGL